jgi:hypothetical protein
MGLPHSDYLSLGHLFCDNKISLDNLFLLYNFTDTLYAYGIALKM